MRVLMISKACVVGTYQRKLEEIARLGVDLTVVVPPSWRDERGEMALERAHTEGYTLVVNPIRFNGNFHLHYYPGLNRWFTPKPDIVHIDEEPYNAATWQALRLARRAGAKTLFFSWQNILRRYPPPFSLGEWWTLRSVDHVIVGTESAGAIWRQKGYEGPLTIIPQFGVDPDLFRPPTRPIAGRTRTLGYVGRLVPEKGVDVLLRALGQIMAEGLTQWRLDIIGGGPQRDALERLVAELGLDEHVTFIGQVPSTQMPVFFRQLDVLLLPSLTRPNWKEQFGRVLIEAMACGSVVVASDSGAIPDVVGDAALITSEGDVTSLAHALRRLLQDDDLRQELARRGRERVTNHFTMQQIARETVNVYREMLGLPRQD
ncbi:MAG: glycosyltransferase family 4 protein [Anaerolineae bacterium]|nr:glycosyltransferase family 4 protein [Anaerolineae bacterium]